jgi:hypothetical protein
MDMETSRKGEISSFLAMMRLRSLGRYEPLWPAPKRWALKCFGGKMTIEEFRSYGGRTEPPRVHWPFEKYNLVQIGALQDILAIPNEKRNGSSSSESARKMKEIENASAEVNTLKLKRMKPLQRAESKLENMLGLTRKVQGLDATELCPGIGVDEGTGVGAGAKDGAGPGAETGAGADEGGKGVGAGLPDESTETGAGGGTFGTGAGTEGGGAVGGTGEMCSWSLTLAEPGPDLRMRSD